MPRPCALGRKRTGLSFGAGIHLDGVRKRAQKGRRCRGHGAPRTPRGCNPSQFRERPTGAFHFGPQPICTNEFSLAVRSDLHGGTSRRCAGSRARACQGQIREDPSPRRPRGSYSKQGDSRGGAYPWQPVMNAPSAYGRGDRVAVRMTIPENMGQRSDHSSDSLKWRNDDGQPRASALKPKRDHVGTLERRERTANGSRFESHTPKTRTPGNGKHTEPTSRATLRPGKALHRGPGLTRLEQTSILRLSWALGRKLATSAFSKSLCRHSFANGRTSNTKRETSSNS